MIKLIKITNTKKNSIILIKHKKQQEKECKNHVKL